MPSLIPWIATLSAVLGGFLVIADLAETPQLERLYLEVALFVPLILWLLAGRFRVRRRSASACSKACLPQ